MSNNKTDKIRIIQGFKTKYTGWALVTGASSGLGVEFAKQLAAQKMDLVLTARRKDRLEALANELKKTYQINVHIIQQDLSELNASEKIYHELKKKNIPISILVNNAGFGLHDKFTKHTSENISSMIQVNCTALTELTRLFLPDMLSRKNGCIIQVASIGGFQPVPYHSVYAATKSYVLNFSMALARELKDSGVQIFSLCPGYMPTEFDKVAGSNDSLDSVAGQMTPQLVVAQTLAKLNKNPLFFIPGLRNRIMTHLQRITPRKVVIDITAKMMKKD